MKLFAPLIVVLLSITATAADNPRRTVVLVSVDGLAHYYFDDPKADMPTIRQLAAEGARAERMKASLPTVTWPNHTTLVTGVQPGRHGVVGNSYLDRAAGKVVTLLPDPNLNKDEIVKAPTVYDLAHAAGLKTGAVIWPASRGAKSLDWTVPDVALDSLWQEFGTPSLLAECRAAGIPVDKQGEWCKAGKGQDRDRMYVQILNHILHNHRPDLAMIHLVEVDHVEHAHGPQSPEAYAAIKFADDRVKEIWDQLKKDFPQTGTLIVTADHGFNTFRRQVMPNVVLRKAGLLEVKGMTISGGRVRGLSQGGACFIYVLDAANRDALIEQTAGLFKDVEGIEPVIMPKDFGKYGMADAKADPHAPDLILSAKNGYSFSDGAGGELVMTPESKEVRGTHGYNPDQPGMYASFVAWGAGIQAGAKLGSIENVDVAPTIAKLLNVPMNNVDGKVLTDALAR